MRTDAPRSENPTRYLAVACAFALAVLAANAAFTGWVKWHTGWTQDGALLAYQRAKLARSGMVDTVFIGDSALGNAIDSREFDALAGTRSLNLAMTGYLGFPASFNMLRLALQRHPELRNVVVMQAANIMKRPVSYRGYVLTAPDGDLRPFPRSVRIRIVRDYLAELFDWNVYVALYDHLRGKPALLFENDYVRQSGRRASAAQTVLKARGIDPRATFFLGEIVRLCRTWRLNCVYADGPYPQEAVGPSRRFLAESAARAEALGIRVAVASPMPLQPSQQGDTENHVAPADKKLSTRFYARKLEAWLKPASDDR